jgi:PPOX class probable F420-dependent enzyme
MTDLPDQARELIESAALAHLVTLNADGSPQVSVIWIGLEDGEIVSGHLGDYQKVRNIRRDPRVALTIEGPGRSCSSGSREPTWVRMSRSLRCRGLRPGT